MFYDDGKVSPLPVVFFMSYMMVAGVVLLNIVVAGMHFFFLLPVPPLDRQVLKYTSGHALQLAREFVPGVAQDDTLVVCVALSFVGQVLDGHGGKSRSIQSGGQVIVDEADYGPLAPDSFIPCLLPVQSNIIRGMLMMAAIN